MDRIPTRTVVHNEKDRTPIRPVIHNEKDWYALNAKEGAEFVFNNRIYRVFEKKGQLRALEQISYKNVEEICTAKYEWAENFVADVCHDSFSLPQNTSFSGRLLPADKKHFRVDVDKTLLYRGALPAGKEGKESDFHKITLYHKSYGTPTVYVNKQMLAFLKLQHGLGAKISITSTGGWDAGSGDAGVGGEQYLRSYLENEGLELKDFDNKETLNTGSYINIGLSQKYRVLGDQDIKGRWNIMIDDQWHQRAGFTHSIPAEQFGMG